jgi:hypothetical protein
VSQIPLWAERLIPKHELKKSKAYEAMGGAETIFDCEQVFLDRNISGEYKRSNSTQFPVRQDVLGFMMCGLTTV